jgi:hypothetical protein
MLARRIQASALAIVSSKSLDKRLSQANVRSITQRFGSGLNLPVLSDRVTISIKALAKLCERLGQFHGKRGQQWDRAVDILDIGRVHLQGKQ